MENGKVDIGCGIFYPTVLDGGVVTEIAPTLPKKYVNYIKLRNRDILSMNHPAEHLTIKYSGEIDGWAVFKNEYGYEKRIRATMLNGRPFIETKVYVDGEPSAAPLFYQKSNNANTII